MFQKINVSHTRFTINDLLVKTYLPKFQRLEDKDHTHRITQGLFEYYQKHGELTLIGSISLAQLPGKEKYVLFDGQHRLRSLEKVTELIPDLRWNVVRVDLYHVESEEEAKTIYDIINSSKKVELFTGDVTPFIIPQLQRYFRDRYPDYCKTSRKPLGLNINLEHLARHFAAKRVIEKLGLGIDGAEELIDRVKQLNQFYSDQPPAKFLEWGVKDFDKKYKDLLESKDPFYLGLYRSYEWIDRLIDARPFEQQDHHAYVINRKTIPKKLRTQVWEKNFGSSLEGECYCCRDVIRFDGFHVAHRVSVFDGGDNSIENLTATCITCNLEMGTTHIDEYKNLFHK